MSGVCGRLVEKSFGVIARLRHARVFHPRGVWFSGRLRAAPEFEPYFGGRECAVHVRMSKALGIPGRLPDGVGLGLRIDTASPTVHHPAGVALAPAILTALRATAYRGSREGRGAEPSAGSD